MILGGHVGQPERATQDRVIALFRDELGYRYLGDWKDRTGNNNVEEGLLSAWLTRKGYTPGQISTALYKLVPRRTTTAARSMATTRKSISCCATACR